MAGDNLGKVIFSADRLSFSVGTQQLLDNTALTVHEGERIALVGRNGAGKSTFLRIINGEETVTDGKIVYARKLRINFLPQEFALDESRTVYENIHAGMEYFIDLLHKYEILPLASPEHAMLEQEINRHNAWNPEQRMKEIITRLNVPNQERRCGTLSGGEKRRVALAAAVVSEPELLLLDEPTNHLDAETIGWIENYLVGYRGTCIFITHDRYFLDRVATRVVELDNGKLYSYDGSYADFLEGKAERECREDAEDAKRRKFLSSEIDWVRRSPKARLRRNLGRLKRYHEAAAQTDVQRIGDIELVIPDASRLGNKVVTLKNVSLQFNGISYIRDFSFEFPPGCKTGIIGRNGTGKTSLLKIITGQLPPTSGSAEAAPTVEFNYIDQGRLKLNPELTVLEEIGEGTEFVKLGEERIGIWGYLKRFLFADERIKTQIKYLSGGEKARLILAKILKQGGNFLILDEPTNDLDLSTLRLLEEALAQYRGCVIVVSHDRYFLNRVCSEIIAFEGEGEINCVPGDYDHYLEKRRERETAPGQNAAPKPAQPVPHKPRNPKKLSYKEQRELDCMEERVTELENEIKNIEAKFAAPDFFKKYGEQSAALQNELESLKSKLDGYYTRWEELEAKAAVR
ncbi:MAG: ABC-F family ATP-binding cassette domain-containing protein [Victivallaceae bacterium]|nr:ABC-F family ATP-binding cassette domain-containing protein [Victivallaceae bacterium]